MWSPIPLLGIAWLLHDLGLGFSQLFDEIYIY